MSEPLRLLAIFPHPDDETLGCGPALARYAAEGVEVHLVTATRGQMGWTGPAEKNPGPDALGQMREAELQCAARKLGLYRVHLLDYMDGALEQVDRPEIVGVITGYIRGIRPQVVLTYAQEGVYGHPDHIALAQITTAALVTAADGSYTDPQSLAPHRVLKYYASVDSCSAVQAFHDLVGPVRMMINGVERTHAGWEEWAITTRFDTRDYFPQVDEAIHCHQTQFTGFGNLINLSVETRRSLFTEATFVLNYSLVNTSVNETDLFEGIR